MQILKQSVCDDDIKRRILVNFAATEAALEFDLDAAVQMKVKYTGKIGISNFI